MAIVQRKPSHFHAIGRSEEIATKSFLMIVSGVNDISCITLAGYADTTEGSLMPISSAGVGGAAPLSRA
jgi:hypothetical protein